MRLEVASLWGMWLGSREESSLPCAGINGYNRKTSPGTESGVTAFSFVITCSKGAFGDRPHSSYLKGPKVRPHCSKGASGDRPHRSLLKP